MEIITMLVLIFAYFLPSIIAMERDHKNEVAVMLINLVLGWTFIGWFGCLIWSVWRKD